MRTPHLPESRRSVSTATIPNCDQHFCGFSLHYSRFALTTLFRIVQSWLQYNRPHAEYLEGLDPKFPQTCLVHTTEQYQCNLHHF